MGHQKFLKIFKKNIITLNLARLKIINLIFKNIFNFVSIITFSFLTPFGYFNHALAAPTAEFPPPAQQPISMPSIYPMPLPMPPVLSPNLPSNNNPVNPAYPPINGGPSTQPPINPGFGSPAIRNAFPQTPMPNSPVPMFSPSPLDPNFKAAPSLIQGINCPLVDARQNQEIMAAIESLQRSILTIPECSSDKTVGDMAKQTQNLKLATQNLQTFWNDPNAAADNLPMFEQSLETAIQNVSQIGDVLNNNLLLNSQCGQQMMSSGKALLAFSDIVNGIAPFALLAGSMSSNLKVAVPYIVGIVGVSSVVKIIGTMIDKQTLDMNRYEHRQAVLQNTCEFSKIAQKVKLIKLAQSGQLESITEELKSLDSFLNSQYPDGKNQETLLSLIEYRDKMRIIYNKISVQLKKDQVIYTKLSDSIAVKKDDSFLICSYGKSLTQKSEPNVKKFPTTVVSNFNSLIALSKNPHIEKIDQEVLLKHESDTRNQLFKMAQNGKSNNEKECAEITLSWITSVDNLLKATETEFGYQQNQIQNKLNSNPEFKKWSTQTNQLEKDRDTLKKLVLTLDNLNKDTSAIEKSEIHLRMRELKASLFGVEAYFKMGESPVLAWLDHIFKVFSSSVNRFEQSWNRLRAESFRLTETGARLAGDKKGPKSCLWFFGKNNCHIYGLEDFKNNLASTKRDITLQDSLGTLTEKDFPKDSEAQQIACKRLEESWLNWLEVLDHLSASYVFCETIKPLLDSSVERKIVDYCEGDKTITGQKIIKPSILDERQNYLVKKNYKAAALIVAKKIQELHCSGQGFANGNFIVNQSLSNVGVH
jgi:hypothetical protein